MPHSYVGTTLNEDENRKLDQLRREKSRYQFCRECIKKGLEVIEIERRTQKTERGNQGNPPDSSQATGRAPEVTATADELDT